MRKRFAYKSDDQYQQITVDETFFTGVVCFVKLQNVAKPKYIENGKTEEYTAGSSCGAYIERYP